MNFRRFFAIIQGGKPQSLVSDVLCKVDEEVRLQKCVVFAQFAPGWMFIDPHSPRIVPKVSDGVIQSKGRSQQ